MIATATIASYVTLGGLGRFIYDGLAQQDYAQMISGGLLVAALALSLDLLLALNSGHPGLATLHANSAREALIKLCTLPLLAGENISSQFVVPTVAGSVDLVALVRHYAIIPSP